MILGNSHFCERCQVDNFSQTFRAWDVDETIAIVVPFDSTVLVQGNKEKWNCKGKHMHRWKTWNWFYIKAILPSFDDKQTIFWKVVQ